MWLPLMLLCCLAPAVAFAAHPLLTDDAATVEPSHIEAETALEYHSERIEGAREAGFLIKETVTFGIFNNLDAYVTVPYRSYKSIFEGAEREIGISDIMVGAKWNFLSIDTTSLAIKPFAVFVFPSGDERKGKVEAGNGFGAVLAVSQELNSSFSVDANLEFLLQKMRDSDQYYKLRGSVAGNYRATKELKVVGEVSVSKSEANAVDATTSKETNEIILTYLSAGAVYAVNKHCDIDMGVRLGLHKEADELAVLGGVTFKF
jgi:hypothetical protein